MSYLSHFEISIEEDLEQIHPNGICYGCTFSTLKQLTKTVYVDNGEDEELTDLNIQQLLNEAEQDMKNSADQGGCNCYPQRPKAEVDNTLLNIHHFHRH